MNRKDKKKLKKAAIPHGFRKTCLSKSNCSLSQSLNIASYKKRINDLSKNNRFLAVALQESRVEAAFQGNLLRDFTRDSQNILFARLKMNEMAQTMVKFVTDLEEVRTYLKTDALNRYNAFQKDRSPNARICKAPCENTIEEVPEVSEKSPTEVYGDNALSMPLISKPGSDDSEDVQNRASAYDTTPSSDVEMAPILFVDDDAVKNKKSSSRSKSSAVLSNADKGSLTPELNIDLTCYKPKRSSSRRMTQFIFPEVRSTKSGRKSVTPKNSSEELVTPEKPESPPVLHHKQSLAKVSSHQDKLSKSPFRQSESKPKITSNEVVPVDNKANVHGPLDVPMVEATKMETAPLIVQPADSNHTVLLCEDMELTDVINPVYQMINCELPAVKEIIGDSQVSVNIPKRSEKLDSDDNSKCESKPLKQSDCHQSSSVVVDSAVKNNKKVVELPDCPQSNVTVDKDKDSSEVKTPKLSDFRENSEIINDVLLPEIKDIEFDEEIQNVGELTFCDSNEQAQQDKDTEDQHSLKVETFSPARRSRPKKSVKYTVFFSSDESDKESPPVKKINSQTKKLFNSRKQKSFDSSEVPPVIPRDKAFSEVENKKQKTDSSVYNLDVSNSKKPSKKKYLQTYRIAKSRKDDSKELPKPLFDNCSVTKLKAGEYKFSKNEITPKKLKAIQEQLKEQSPLVVNHCISPYGILKKKQYDSCQNKIPETTKPTYYFSDSVDDMEKIQSPIKDQHALETPKSESKRVSFAATDTVCNFRRMSVSKKIADNKKERRTSKSALDFVKNVDITMAKSHLKTDISSENTVIQKADPIMNFSFSSDDTELYNFAVPSNSQLPVLPVKQQCFPSKIKMPTTSELELSTGNTASDLQSKKIVMAVKSPKQIVELSPKIRKPAPSVTGVATDNTARDLEIKKAVLTAKSSKQTVRLSPSKIKNPAASETEVSTDNTAGALPAKKVVITVKSPKQTGKLSLKRNKISQNTEISPNSTKIQDQISILPLESPKSRVIKTKRKSLFKEVLIEDLKENIDLNCQVSDKQQEAVQSIPCVDENVCFTVKEPNKKSSGSKKRQSKVSLKLSAKRGNLSGKLNVIQPSSEIKNNPGTKSVENSPVLKDALNTTITDDAILPKRRSKCVSYKEPSLNKKLRRT